MADNYRKLEADKVSKEELEKENLILSNEKLELEIKYYQFIVLSVLVGAAAAVVAIFT